MCQIYLHLLFLVTLSCPFCAENTTKITVLCPEEQKAFRGSCYEFVSLQRNFSGAQAWCEQRGGHLAFIPDEDTQYFLQRHLDPKKDMWFGAAPSTDLQIPPNVEGPLIWLNGSYITYSNWVSSPQPGAACGHMLRDSGFQWEATIHCNREMAFICQFESGRSIVCAGRNTTLQCGSGQVLMIDGGFYGRENNYYCRSTLSPPTTHKQYQCSWVDVVEPLTAQCHGRSVCNITEVMESFGEPCPQLGSYLSLDYHCNDGLTLSVSIVAAVFDDIAISVKWLLHLPEGNLQCNLSPGDGLVINLHSLEGLESSMVHKYTHPGTFVVAVECTSRDIHITAQKIITIQEPIRQFGVIRCYAGKLSFHGTNCRAYYEEQFQIQMEVKAGTNVTYRIQHGGTVLSGLSVVRGNIPQNVTVTPEMVKLLGPGCHQLTLYASNMVTFPEVAADLQMCVLEKVAGLQASVLTERDDCLDSPDITVGVSLKGGAPVLLLFTLTGENISFSETRKMKTRKEIFRIGHQIQGSVQVKLRAWNIFSSLEVDVDMFGSCGKDSALKQRKKHVRVVRSSLKITATPSASVNDKNEVIVLTINQDLKDPKKHYQWSCRDDTPLYKKHTIKTSSSPDKPDPTTKSPVTKDPSNPSNPATPSSSSSATGSSSSGLTCTISPQSGTIFDVFKIICNTGTPCSKCQYCFKTDDDNSNSSVDGLKIVVEAAVARMNKLGILSGETLGQMFHSVGNNLNGQSDKNTKQKRQKLREQLLDTMIETVNKVPTKAPEEVQVASRGLSAVILKGTELSSSAQEEASLFFANISLSLLHMQVNDSGEIQLAASSIVEATSNILDYSSSKNISDALLLALHNTQSALLTFKGDNEEPIVIQKAHIGMLVNRVAPGSVQTKPINLPNNSSSSFFLPKLPSNILSHRTVDVRMLSLDKNPFSWNDQGNISGLVGALSLTRKDGSDIPVENLSEDIEILMPRPVGEEVTTTVLELSNYSTTVLNISSAYTTLVLKMMPSKDPLPFKLFLGYMDYPTDTNYIVMTEMPHQGATQEERYTWLVEPEKLKGNTGEHYLLVRPIVGPGIKSIKANLSITSINTACQFWNTTTLDWNSPGCRVGVNTTDSLTQCLCNHLTFFGSSFFVTPNLVDPSRTAELFATFAENPVVVCFVGALFVVYLLVVVWARRKDVNDVAKVKVTVLEDNDPIDDYCYLLSISTGYRRGASTSSQVTITLLGSEGNSEPHHLTDSKKCVFERGAVDMFLLTAPYSMGDLQGIRLWHNNSGSHPDCNLFFMKTTKDFHDGHLWYSVISRPPSSTFTCVQRVSCCFSLLLCTMLTSIMFYGIPADPSEQTMDLGQFEFTWQQFMIGVQSSLIMFPVNILIVSVFRNTRPWETACCKRKTEKPDALEQTSSPKSATNNINVNVTLETVIKDITRIAHSLSKTVKSNIPCTEPEFGPGQQVDINTVLSVVEDFIKHKNKSSDTAQTKTQSLHNLVQPQLPEGSASKHPGSPVEAIQKKSNKTQYLYRQLCHIDKELNQLGPSGFPTPHSYSQALQQVQGMKGFLEDQLFTFSCVDQDEVTQKKLSPTDSTDGRDRQKKRACCHGGLPWWFIFVGWLLVIATSCVAGYFTMLYGLKFGKQRSISWLVSMIISFFQSILITQPLKKYVLNSEPIGDCKVQRTTRENNSVYEPPAPTDVEKMRRKKILEQKAFALLREILTYMGFMWMLLLVAYSERDPNAFFLNQHIRNSFSGQISDSMNLGDVFIWAKTSLLNNLFGVYPEKQTSKETVKLYVPGFITDGNSKLVGNARLRQLRVQKNSCQIAGSMLQLIPDCHAPYSWEVEDMGSYDPGWNHSARDNNYTSTSRPWEYQTQSQLRAYPVWGTIALYRGGGFLTELGPDLQNANSILEHLFRNKWLDMYTRAIFVEFTVYNANVNLFCIVTLLLESTGVGAFQFSSDLQSVRLYPSTGGLHIFVMIAEIIYLLFILYYMFLQGKLMKRQRWAYFRSKWNLLELTIILLTWSAVAVFIQRTLLGNRDMTYYQNHKDQFPSFYETARADSLLQYLIAFLVLLSTIKLWHLLRLNPKMNMITATLQRAWSDICSFLVVIVIMLVAYSIASNVIYGWKISSYKTLADALVTIISLQIGIFNYDEVLNGTPLLGGLLFGSCIVFMTFVVLNLLISVILVAFNQEQIYHKPSDEEEIVDLMLMKICNLFGIKYKNTKDTPGSDVKGASDLTLNNGKNIINSSSADADIFSTDSSVNL
ncbi:Polycystic kidney disease protein 1-like 2 PC1-like 2 protein [Collichthys lucidus]|uniref:Polycystic kidney disease protein 1-like 2 PC1-like 2 protein n=1 Tax=Collichthys lucidus TaxID=240159 RepID=A0A4U5U0I4_COLLU|nr:Polycystic kidney disease protein 1-like 2 PC1-like 2 protein [Collichthys lucidus]